MNPVAIVMAIEATRRESHSAMPNAPMVEDRIRERVAVQKVRVVTARTLRRVADRLEPKAAVTYG